MGKLCQYCSKREAKIHFTEIKDGKQTEMHLCEQCAHEKNVAMTFPSLLGKIVGATPPSGDSEAVKVQACPECGLEYTDFKSRGRLGCPTCYDSFAGVLKPLLEKVHGSPIHTGGSPRRHIRVVPEAAAASPPVAEPADADLRAQLDEAIAAEDYEKAAAIRDQIRELTEADGES